MTFFERVRHLLSRSEVDELDRGTGMLAGYQREAGEREAYLSSLHRGVSDERHHDLRAAMQRRNAVR